MILSRETIIIGGLPNPVGGVTTFLSRLVKAYPQWVAIFIDLYLDDKKRIPHNFHGVYKLIPNKIWALLEICKIQLRYKAKDIFFNFSSSNSLIFFLLLPKFNNEWSLMLHHGNLTSKTPKFLLKKILKKFNRIYALGDRQESFYREIDESLNIVIENSYVPAHLIAIDSEELEPLVKAQDQGYKIIIGSGFPRYLYQHHLLIDVTRNNENTYLFLFLYGEGELKEELLALKHPRIKVFFDKDEDVFNNYLASANLYIRPTLEDSFGIACADAVEFGVSVIASDVCNRYPGVLTYNFKNDGELYDLSKKLL